MKQAAGARRLAVTAEGEYDPRITLNDTKNIFVLFRVGFVDRIFVRSF
jgi:hypothetical protein